MLIKSVTIGKILSSYSITPEESCSSLGNFTKTYLSKTVSIRPIWLYYFLHAGVDRDGLDNLYTVIISKAIVCEFVRLQEVVVHDPEPVYSSVLIVWYLIKSSSDVYFLIKLQASSFLICLKGKKNCFCIVLIVKYCT